MLNGVLNIHKPPGLTSHDVVQEARKLLKFKKIGHTGTLDPEATGVLPLCLGKATKLIQYFPGDKQYIAEITLGVATTTYDQKGEITSQKLAKTDQKTIIEALNRFTGKITQQVPPASATHYQGKKLYEYAHKGIIIEDLPTKEVEIYKIELLDIINQNTDTPIVKLIVDCSSGTYIRSIANELGQVLGFGAHLSKLIRTMANNIRIEDSITLENLEDIVLQNKLNDHIILPVQIINLPKYQVGFGQMSRLRQGQYFRLLKDTFDNDETVLLVNKQNEIVAIGIYVKNEKLIKPKTVLITS